MPRYGFLLLLVLSTGLAEPAPAQAPVPSSPLTPEKIAAKEKAVAEHAEKRAGCRRQAKEAGLALMER